jgi:hypothetical protein
MASTLKLVFISPGQTDKTYFRRDLEEIIAGQRTWRPEVTDIVGDAHKFNHAASGVAFRDKYRSMYPRYSIFLEDAEGNRRHEREAQPQTEPEDKRLDWWEAVGNGGLGFVVRAAVTPSLGKCWAMRACDVPSLAGRHIESVYASTPEAAVARALAIWSAAGAIVKPYDHPYKAANEKAEAQRILSEIQRSKNPGRLRPGSL